MKKLVVLLVVFALANSLHAQVGFNNPSPDAKSLLDLTATDKGLLIPRMTTALRDGIVSATGPTPESLLVYDTDLKGFYFFNAGTWYSLNEWVRTAGSNNVSLTGNATVSGNISNSGTVSTTGLNVAGFSNNALVPNGVIVMWAGTTPPSGWALCDGGGSPPRPDLRGRFIVGYDPSDTDYNAIGKPGGLKAVTLTAAQSGLPVHNHSISDPSHVHGTPGTLLVGGTGEAYTGGPTQFPSAVTDPAFTGITINNSLAQNASQSHENRPPYYTLAYIIKLP